MNDMNSHDSRWPWDAPQALAEERERIENAKQESAAVTRARRKRFGHFLRSSAAFIVIMTLGVFIANTPWLSSRLGFLGLQGIKTFTSINGVATITMDDKASADQLAAVLERAASQPTERVTYHHLTFGSLKPTSRPNLEAIKQTASLAAALDETYRLEGTVSGTDHADFELHCVSSCQRLVLASQYEFDTYIKAWNTLEIVGSGISLERTSIDWEPTASILDTLYQNVYPVNKGGSHIPGSITNITFSSKADPKYINLDLKLKSEDDLLSLRSALLAADSPSRLNLTMSTSSSGASLSVMGERSADEMSAASQELSSHGFTKRTLCTSGSERSDGYCQSRPTPRVALTDVARERWNEVKSILLKYPNIEYASLYTEGSRDGSYQGPVGNIPTS
jgi:hypothetical protein